MDLRAPRRWAATALLAGLTAHSAVTAAAAQGWLSAFFAGFALVAGAATVGVAARIFWARSLALGIGLTVLLEMGSAYPILVRDAVYWTALASSAVLPLLLLGRSMAEHFARPAWAKLWLEPDWRLRAISLSIVASVPAAAGLLRYATSSVWWVGVDDKVVALTAAGLFAVGALATLRGRVVGLFILLASALASLGLATETLFRLVNPLRGGYRFGEGVTLEIALAGMIPAALICILGFAVVARPMGRFVRAGPARRSSPPQLGP